MIINSYQLRLDKEEKVFQVFLALKAFNVKFVHYRNKLLKTIKFRNIFLFWFRGFKYGYSSQGFRGKLKI